MNPAVATLLLLAAVTYALKAAGPLVLGGGRSLPAWIERSAWLLPGPLLAALVVTSSVVSDGAWAVDARLAGVLAAGGALLLRAPLIVVVVSAAAATAAIRAIA